jgi:hypothetical protein
MFYLLHKILGTKMLKILIISSVFLSLNAFSQIDNKPDPNSQINAEEQAHGLPGGSAGSAYSVRTKKRSLKVPAVVAPVENHSPASCADSLGGKGSANFTACEAAKKTR